MGLILLVTDSLGFPRYEENISFRETYVSLVSRSTFPFHDIVHLGRGGQLHMSFLKLQNTH